MTHDEMIAVIAAHRDGKKVQCQVKNHADWYDYHNGDEPQWDFNSFDYRIKPDPLVLWGLYKPDGSFYGTYRTLESAQDDKKYHDLRYPQCDHLTLKKFVEVVE